VLALTRSARGAQVKLSEVLHAAKALDASDEPDATRLACFMHVLKQLLANRAFGALQVRRVGPPPLARRTRAQGAPRDVAGARALCGRVRGVRDAGDGTRDRRTRRTYASARSIAPCDAAWVGFGRVWAQQLG